MKNLKDPCSEETLIRLADLVSRSRFPHSKDTQILYIYYRSVLYVIDKHQLPLLKQLSDGALLVKKHIK